MLSLVVVLGHSELARARRARACPEQREGAKRRISRSLATIGEMLRAAALYQDDGQVQKKRQSHENPSITKLYEIFLKEPLGHKSHELLHTHYTKRGEDVPHKT